MNPEQRYCQHPNCQAHAAEELLYMARRLRRADLIEHARESLQATVRCRMQPRKGPVPATLPEYVGHRALSEFVARQVATAIAGAILSRGKG